MMSSNPIQHPPPPPLASIAFLWDPHPSSEADLHHALLRTTAELQSTRLAAQEELRRMEAQTLHLTQLLDTATRERDELRRQCHALLLLLSSNTHPHPTSDAANSTEEDESSNGTSPNPVSVQVPIVPSQDVKLEIASLEEMAVKKGLPEKGKLVEAVVAAGPLLQTLLLAGPLPKWRHPPPAVRCFDVPVFAPGRELREEAESLPEKTFTDGLGSLALPASSSPMNNVKLGRELTDGVKNFHF
ncbi:enabled-like protein (DUF1635) [Rhynchospora pubera]|uniref:Enabled-like protein (DUF1635) n=1 Tax=Rhynchospora pubera TaxID=906938 RepID=A0AAV8BWZ1_9POAL|nr:enabled-like protein (DUF1635) [Rhynchospora pubera]KAJ4800587.1 enabled-like protein (DUF1635) [Rhynchospora pubera]